MPVMEEMMQGAQPGMMMEPGAGMPMTPQLSDDDLLSKEKNLGAYHELGQESLEGPIEGIEESDFVNYASNTSVVDKIQTILDTVVLARDRRRSKVDQDWNRYRDIYNCRRTTAFYNGRSKLFLPAGRKSVDTLTRIAREAILSDPYLSVETDIPQWADVGSQFMKYLVEEQGKIKQVVPMFLRQLYQIGTSCIELGFKKEVKQVKYRDKAGGEIKTRKMFSHYGPTYTVLDMSKVFVWPETATSYSDLRIVFKDSTISADKLRELVEDGIYTQAQVQKVLQAKNQDIQAKTEPESQATKELGNSVLDYVDIDLLTIWAKFKLPKQDEAQWNLIEVSGDIPLRIIENPWWFQLPPLLFGAIFREQGYFYGHGIIETMEMWQYMLNDMGNQTMDVQTFTLNPFIAYDPALVDDPDLINLEPGAKIPIAPEGIKFERPPAQMAMEGLTMVRFLLNIIQEDTNANALVQGAPREGLGKATGTATGVSQLFAAANSAVLDQVEDLEAQVFTPLLQFTEIMIHEFMDDAIVLRNTGPDGIILTQRVVEPSDLVLSTDIRWVASLRLKEKSAKSQQALNFLNIAVGIPPQLTEAQGFRIGYKHLIKMVYSGMALPDVDSVIIDTAMSLPGIPPEMEIELIEAGRSVIASAVDSPENHKLHIQSHMLYNPPTELARIRMQEHISSHMQAMYQNEIQMRAMVEQSGASGVPGGASRGPVGGPESPIRPQEMPSYETEGAANQGIMSQMNQ